MDTLESQPATPLPENDSLQQQLESLRQLVISLLVLVIVVSGTINIYLYRQLKYARNDLGLFRQQASAIIGEFQTRNQPALKEFVDQLKEFEKSPKANEAYRQLMRKYGIITNVPPVSAPAPAPVGPAATVPAEKGKK